MAPRAQGKTPFFPIWVPPSMSRPQSLSQTVAGHVGLCPRGTGIRSIRRGMDGPPQCLPRRVCVCVCKHVSVRSACLCDRAASWGLTPPTAQGW